MFGVQFPSDRVWIETNSIQILAPQFGFPAAQLANGTASDLVQMAILPGTGMNQTSVPLTHANFWLKPQSKKDFSGQ